MKRLVRDEWRRVTALAILTLVATGVTHAGIGGIYLFAIGFMAIVLLIERHQGSKRPRGRRIS
jgi:hypothetical protein